MANTSPFIPQKKILHPVVHRYDNTHDIVERELKDVLVSHGDNPGDFVTEKRLIEISRKNRIEYVQSFKDEVGIENILRKFNETGDPSVLNVITRHPGPVDENGYEQVIDITGLKDNVFDNASMVAQARAVIAQLDPEVKAALLNMTDADLAVFLKTKLAEAEKSKEESSGE